MTHKHWLSLSLIILLFGCTPTSYEEATVTNEPEAVVRHLTSTPIPSTPTRTVSPTSTVEPTSTAESLRNIFLTEDNDNGTVRPMITRRPPNTPRPPTITPTIDVVGTQEAVLEAHVATQEAIPVTIRQVQTPREYDSYLSPDGRKRTEIIVYNCTEVGIRYDGGDMPQYTHEQLNLYDEDEGTMSLIDERTEGCGFQAPGNFEGWFWSENSRFFYYTDRRAFGAEGCNLPGPRLTRFIRYDTEQKSIFEMGGGELSPDGTMLAIVSGSSGMYGREESPYEVVVWDVESGEEIGRSLRPDVDVDGYGGLTWSPDGTKLVYLTSTVDHGACGRTYNHLVEVDLSTSTQTILTEVELSWSIALPSFTLKEIILDDPDQIILSSNSWGYDQSYNRKTVELSEVLPDYYTVFDRVMGRPVATITPMNEMIDNLSVPYTMLYQYTFESVEIAAAMANAIQPNGTSVHTIAPDGTEVQEAIEVNWHIQLHWWHVDDTIYMHMSRGGNQFIEAITEALNVPRLNVDVEREGVYIRIQSWGKMPIEEVTLDLGGDEVIYSDLAVDETTTYQLVENATNSGTIRIVVDGEVREEAIQLGAVTEEVEMLPAGNYMIYLTVFHNGTVDILP